MLRLVVEAPRGTLRYEYFARAIGSQFQGARDVERAIAAREGTRARVDWRVADLSANGVYVVELNPVIRKPPKDLRPDFTKRITRGYVNQIQYVRNEHGVPPDLSTDTVEKLEEVTRHFEEEGVQGMTAVDIDSGEEASIDSETGETLRELVTPAWSSIGSVTGKLDTVGRRPKPYANVYEAVTGRAIRCEFDDDLQEEVLAAFGRRVIARGRVSYNSENRLTRVKLSVLEVLPRDDDAPDSMYGRIPQARRRDDLFLSDERTGNG